MSPLQSKQQLFHFISENSSLLELLSVIRLSTEPEESKAAERILLQREEGLVSQVRHLKGEMEELKKERDSLKKANDLLESEKKSTEEELKRSRREYQELKQSTDVLIEDHVLLTGSKMQEEDRYKNAVEEAKRAEIEAKKKMDELKNNNKELEEINARYYEICHHGISVLEKMAANAGFKRKDDTADARKGNIDDHNPSSKQFNGDDDLHHLDKQAPFAPAERLNGPIIAMHSNDEDNAAGSAGIARITHSQPNLSVTKMLPETSVSKRSSDKTKEASLGTEDPSVDLRNRRKRSMADEVGHDRSDISSRKTQKTDGICRKNIV